MPMWNPWRGCKKCSEGCLHCYIHKGDAKRGVDTSMVVKTKDFDMTGCLTSVSSAFGSRSILSSVSAERTSLKMESSITPDQRFVPTGAFG